MRHRLLLAHIMINFPLRLLLPLLLAAPLQLNAQTFFVGADYLWHQLEVGNTRFKPVSSRVHLGFWMLRGIGLELRATQSLNSDTIDDLRFEISDSTSLALRFQSPSDLGFRAYMLVGGTQFNLKGASSQNADFPGTERFQGGYGAIGLMREVGVNQLSLTVEYERHFVDEEQNLEPAGWSLGLFYEF
ncbi:MAG: hypothetical protein ACWA44_09575 [Thiotrichales bacterium]